MIEKEHTVQILESAKTALKEKDAKTLKDLSNQTIHSASVYQDTESITLAVIIYALSKIIEREVYIKHKNIEEITKLYNQFLANSINALEKDNEKQYADEIKKLTSSLNKISGSLKDEIKDVLEKARINKASRIYEHGISMSQTADILGISLWEFIEYAGQRQEKTNLNISLDEKNRIKNILELFAK